MSDTESPSGQLGLFDPADEHQEPPSSRIDTPEPADQKGTNTEHERRLASLGRRKSVGAYYTPSDVVEGLLKLTLEPILAERAKQGINAVTEIRVLDPSCGTGNFLVAAGVLISDQLTALGMDETTAQSVAFGPCLIGADIDPEAAEICRAGLRESAGQTADLSVAPATILTNDALLMFEDSEEQSLDLSTGAPTTWSQISEAVGCTNGGFDLVIGNPPFLNQLGSETSRGRAYDAELKRRFGRRARGYTDPAALFLLLAATLARADGGIACLIQPQSVMSTRDAQEIRQSVLANAHLAAMWVADTRVFDADVDVCAPVLRRGTGVSPTRVLVGRDFKRSPKPVELDPGAHTWSPLLAATQGHPVVELKTDGVVGDLAVATADFRDQYYGLSGHVVDAPDDRYLPPLITSGAIDPAHLLWGLRTTKFNKVAYQHPRVVVTDLDENLRTWAEKRLVPKILLATQTKVLEAVVDEDGSLLPSVPVISVATETEDLYRLGALLVSPPVTLVAVQRHLGAALSSEALKLSAKDVLQLPLPNDRIAWATAGQWFREASGSVSGTERRRHLVRAGEAMCAAYEITDRNELLKWWEGRLPKARDDS